MRVRLVLAHRVPMKALLLAVVCAAFAWTAGPAAARSLAPRDSEDPVEVVAVSPGGDSVLVLGDEGASGSGEDEGAGSSGSASDDDDASEERGAKHADAPDAPSSAADPTAAAFAVLGVDPSWFALYCSRVYAVLR